MSEDVNGTGEQALNQATGVSEKSRLVALLLACFFGVFGGHRFYVGKWKTAILMILTFGGMGIWSLIDFIRIIIGNFKDKHGLALISWQ